MEREEELVLAFPEDTKEEYKNPPLSEEEMKMYLKLGRKKYNEVIIATAFDGRVFMSAFLRLEIDEVRPATPEEIQALIVKE